MPSEKNQKNLLVKLINKYVSTSKKGRFCKMYHNTGSATFFQRHRNEDNVHSNHQIKLPKMLKVFKKNKKNFRSLHKQLEPKILERLKEFDFRNTRKHILLVSEQKAKFNTT